jgi:F-type H+-transporting ATPase subunit b
VLINWFTVIAQIVNFLILVVLLKYLLYDRIVRAMDERKRKIQLRLKEAQEKEEAAEREVESLRQKHRDFDEKREKMLSQAKEEADVRRKELTQEARQAVANLRSVWQEAVQREKESFVQDLRKMAATQFYALARKAFEDLAEAELGERMAEVLLARIRTMNKGQREALAASIKEAGGEVVIQSAFEISPEMQKKITESLHRYLVDEIKAHFETESELIAGIELKTRGRKIAWNLEHYLDTMEEAALRALEQEAGKRTGRGKPQADAKEERKRTKEMQQAETQPPHKGKPRGPEEKNED